MKKIKLNKLEVQNSALTREQLKGIMGGSGSSSSSYTYDPCEGKLQGSKCIYSISKELYGTCKYIATSPNKLVCYYEEE